MRLSISSPGLLVEYEQGPYLIASTMASPMLTQLSA